MSNDWLRVNSGDPNVTYGGSGKPLISHDASHRLFRWRDTNAPVDQPQPTSRWSFLPWSSPTRSTKASSIEHQRDTGVIVTSRNDYRSKMMVNEAPVWLGSPQDVIYPSKANLEAVVVDEMKAYNDRPFLFWLFIVDGIALIVLGILSLLWCLSWDLMCYSRFWTGILLVLFGMAGAIHNGDYYKSLWKSWLFIVLGVINAAAVMACTSFTLDTFCHQLIEVIQFNNWAKYLWEMTYRIQNLPDYPRSNLSNLPDWPNANVITCFAMDGIQVVILMLAFLAVTSLLLVIDRFYNSHFVITRMVEPFCEPRLFNPFTQVTMGQAQVFIGFVLQASVHGANIKLWQQTYAPVWAGIIPCLAGVFTALSLKSCGLKHRNLNVLSLILQLLTIVGSVIAIVLVTIGMYENYQTLGTTPVMTYTGFAQRLIVASIFIFCISDITCIVNIFYAVALLIRLIICICCTKAEDQVPMITFFEDDLEDPVLFPSVTEFQKYRILENETLTNIKDVKG